MRTWPTLPTKGYLTRASDPTLRPFMKTSMFVLRMRVATCLRHGAKLKARGACVIVSKTVWEQRYLLLLFYLSSRRLKRHVHIFTAPKRYILPSSLSHLYVIVKVIYMHMRSFISYILFRNCLKLFIYTFVNFIIFIIVNVCISK